MRITLYGEPRTKKNSQRIIISHGRRMVIPSEAYKVYEMDCLRQITQDKRQLIDSVVNVECKYYMKSKRRVDLVNLLEATDDILVRARVIADDNCTIIAGHDGSRVFLDRENPRVVIEITPIL